MIMTTIDDDDDDPDDKNMMIMNVRSMSYYLYTVDTL